MASNAFSKCESDLLAVGYVKVENAGFIGVVLSRSESAPPIVQIVSPGSPAAGAGILAGDVIFEIDGEAVNSTVAAMQKLFGGVGQPRSVKYRRDGREATVTLVRAPRVKPST
jgi:S1-C subfamily serine protease